VKKDNFINILKQSLIAFLMLQPLFDIYMAFVKEKLDIFGFSLMTIIRIAFVAFFVMSAIILYLKDIKKIKHKEMNKNKKVFIMLILYTLVLGFYVILHHINIKLGNGYYISQGLYSIITEASYVLRLSVPIYLIFAIYLLGIKKDDIKEALVYSFMMFSIFFLCCLCVCIFFFVFR